MNAKQVAEYWLTKVNAYGESGALSEQSDEAILARAYLEEIKTARWTQDDFDALCEIVDALCDLTHRIVVDRRRGGEQLAESIKDRAHALRSRLLE
jgi:hypothetical protein